jgi:inosine/xanthosine triphosphate pyrophosphatase family protein
MRLVLATRNEHKLRELGRMLDGVTLDLLEDLLTRSDLQHLMLIGAYRDNEVTAAHPLLRDVMKAPTPAFRSVPSASAPLNGSQE